MLKKILNKNIKIYFSNCFISTGIAKPTYSMKGIVTDIDDNFIELDNTEIISVKTITRIEIL